MRQADATPTAPLLGKGPGIATLGILRPRAGLERFTLSRTAVPDPLAAFATHVWSVQWDLPPGDSHEQQVLPFPCVHLVFEEGAYRVHGPGERRFVTTLSGKGWVTGVRFTPAGFSAFSRLPMRALVDRVLPAAEVLGCDDPPPASDPGHARTLLVEHLCARAPVASPEIALVDRLVAQAQCDPSVVRVEMLATEAGVSVRSLHRLFERHVGVGSKWIVRRARVQTAAERVARGERVDWSAIAHELGYHDQAHLIRDFRAQIGETPAAYAKRCAAAAQGT